jgi:putative flippase GtrA
MDASVQRRLPPKDLYQLVRFLLVGGWNTAFGYGLFALFNCLFTGVLPYPYMAANVVANIIAITVAFFGYKLFVFRTKGNYLREYLRVWVVYGASTLLGLALLPGCVALVAQFLTKRAYAPYIAQAIVMSIVVLSSFVGHKRFTYKH